MVVVNIRGKTDSSGKRFVLKLGDSWHGKMLGCRCHSAGWWSGEGWKPPSNKALLAGWGSLGESTLLWLTDALFDEGLVFFFLMKKEGKQRGWGQ